MTDLLAVAGLAVDLPGGFSLRDVSLRLAEGERLVVLGPSGGGKTTLLRALAGLTRPAAGSVSLRGRDVTRLPPERRGIGYVPQAATLFPHLTVAGNVAFGLRGAARRERVAETLALVRGEALADRRPDTLSGGEAKRVALARSLAPRPALLLLDEPLGGLDGRGRDEMIETLRETLPRTVTATIHVTHDREEAWLLAERCAVLAAGRVVEEGPLAEVFRRPRTRFAAEFLGGGNVLPAEFPATDRAAVLGTTLPLAAPATGPRGFVVLRPEDLAVAAPGEASGVFAGTLTAAADRGAFVALRVRLPGGGTLLAHVPPASAAGLTPGAEIRLAARAPAHPLPPEETADA